jgi:hypothetical protein
MRSAAAFAILGALSLWAQPSRDAYLNSYRTWRQTDPDLERDAAAGGAAIAERADRVAAAAAKSGAERSAFLLELAGRQAQELLWLQNTAQPAPSDALTKGLTEYIEAQAAAVRKNINAFADDQDRGIQQLKQMLQQEHAALTALSISMIERLKTETRTNAAAAAFEQARQKAAAQESARVSGLKEVSKQIDSETTEWAAYYRKLVEGSRVPVAAPTPVSAPESPSVTPLPLARYVGAWTFPAVGGLYHGSQPDFLDLVVEEEAGRAKGTLFARFKLPPGTTGDPVLRFNFTGEFKNSRSQVFSLTTSEGAKGTLELIPGSAFNLLEINFQIEPRPGKIRQANVVLVKK